MRTMKHWAFAAIAASALALAGCGGGGSSSQTSVASPGGGGTTDVDPAPMPDPAPTPVAVTLPADHGLETGTTTLMAGMVRLDNGLRVTCTPDEGSDSCELTVTEDAVLGTISATSLGGTVTAMFPTTPHSYQAYANLADALLGDHLSKLRANLYHDVADVAADSTATPPVEAVDNGGGVTSSLTTHEEPASEGDAATGTGVSDIFVSVAPEIDDPNDMDNAKEVQRIAVTDDFVTEDLTADPPVVGIADGDTVGQNIMNPVLVDENGMVTSNRMANFDAEADWDRNPAAEWMAELMGGSPQEGFWSYVLSTMEEEAGGRTLHLDLRSDFNPNMTTTGMAIDIARGPADSNDPLKVPVDAGMVSFDTVTVGHGMEIDIPAAGYKGSYMGVRGTFTCIDGGTDEQGICRINQHTEGELVPSENSDILRFTPDVYTADTDWLAAGVWLTTPDDAQGDYAIGAFVFGNMPYKPDATALTAFTAFTGTATYEGQAFGRYAEATGIDGEDKSVGSFEAMAELTADFGTDAQMGSITGDLTGFMAEGESRDWDVNFEQAMIAQQMMDDPNDTDPSDGIDQVAVADSALRFNAGASGHGTGGHALTGFWNGQFYGPTTMDVDGTATTVQPGSVAGTFGLTTERDNEDDYSLTMIGAFAGHKDDE